MSCDKQETKMITYQSFAFTRSSFKNLPQAVNKVIEEIIESAKEDYGATNVTVRLTKFEKFGFNKYFLTFDVVGRFVEI